MAGHEMDGGAGPIDEFDAQMDSRRPDSRTGLTVDQAWCIYSSHFLSMWNSRIYEYANVLLAQHLFPGTLLPTSLIGISETVCMIFSAAALGCWIDSNQNRMSPLAISIVVNRLTIGLCCFFWLGTFMTGNDALKQILFGAILVFGMVEKTTRMSNMLSMERDWIPTLAGYSRGSEPTAGSYDLTHLNTMIRRIDITCKFVAPLAASACMAALPVATFVLGMAIFSGLSVLCEISGLRYVWNRNDNIRRAKPKAEATVLNATQFRAHGLYGAGINVMDTAVSMLKAQMGSLKFYFGTDVWKPSFGIALLHASVLDWAGTLVTWLLNAGFTYEEVVVAKGFGTIFEVGSTFLFPILVTVLAKTSLQGNKGSYHMIPAADKDAAQRDDQEEEDRDLSAEQAQPDKGALAPVVKAGMFGILGLVGMLAPATIVLFWLDSALASTDGQASGQTDAFATAPVSSILFFGFMSVSFAGRWIYDLSVTQLTQCSVSESSRSEFGGAEMALVATFQFGHWIASAIWQKQSDFKWLGLGSLLAVGCATAGFVHWYRH